MSKIFDFLMGKSSIIIDPELLRKNIEFSAKELMIDHAINIIAETCARSTIDVFRYDKTNKKISKTKDQIFYRLNIKPNNNQSGSSFWQQVFYKMLKEGKALVVTLEENAIFLADSFDESNDVILDESYNNVTVKSGNKTFKLKKTFYRKDVFLFDLGQYKTVEFLESFYKDYNQVISASISSFVKNNTSKFALSVPTNVPQMKDKDGNIIDVSIYAERLVGKLLSPNDEIVQLSSGFSIEEISKNKQTMDPAFIKIIKEWGDIVSMKFGIPSDIFWGTKSEKYKESTDDLITFACLYPMNVVEDVINATSITREAYLLGDQVKFNKNTIKYRSALDLSYNIDKLRAVGYSFNDIQEMLDEPTYDEEWAKERYVTKNYMSIVNSGKEVIE